VKHRTIRTHAHTHTHTHSQWSISTVPQITKLISTLKGFMQPSYSDQLSLFLSTVTHLAKPTANLMILSTKKLWALAFAKTQGQCCVQNRRTNAAEKSRTGGVVGKKNSDYSCCVHTHLWHDGPTGKTSPPRWMSVRPLLLSLHHILTRYTLITSSLTPLPTGSQRDSSTNKISHYQLLHRTNFPMSLSLHINLSTKEQPTWSCAISCISAPLPTN
jgi:hypothetical protein